MPRYETDNKFWEIEVTGSKYTQKWGKTGGSVSMNSKDCGSPAAAQKAADKAIAKKVGEGFALVGKKKATKAPAKAPSAPATNLALENAISGKPNDAEAYLVLADSLQGQGDPRGELIVLQHAKKKTSSFLAKHPELTPVLSLKPSTFELEWQYGYIKRAYIGWPQSSYDMLEAVRAAGELDNPENDDIETRDWGAICKKSLLEFLQHPSAKFLQTLRLGCVPGEERMDTSSLSAAIDKAQPECLTTLQINDTADWDISSTDAAIPSNNALVGLEELVIRAGHIRIGKLDLPDLRTLRLESGSLTAKNLKEVAKASWPRLERLEIWCGDPNYGASGSVKDLAPLFAATNAPKLKHFGLMNCPFADEGVKALAASKLLPQLATLNLTMGNLSDRGLDVMIQHEDAFKHLELLDLDDNALTPASKPRVKGLAKKVNFGSEHDVDRAVPRGDNNRYSRFVSVGE